jgi:hypothetical protein
LHRHRIRLVAAAAAALAAVSIAPPAASAQAAVTPGRGSAIAQGIKVDPRQGGLSLGITFGIALAGHVNNESAAEGRSLDLGIIGTILAAEGCDGGDPTLPAEDQPQPFTVRSTDEDGGAEKSNTELQVSRTASASDVPLAKSRVVTAPIGDPGVFEVGATISETTSGVVDGRRVSTAMTEVSGIRFLGGAVEMGGLRWFVSNSSAPDKQTTSSFTIESLKAAGSPLPIPEDAATSFGQLNGLLAPIGFRIEPPVASTAGDNAFLSPMRVAVVPADERESLLGPLFEAILPVRENVFEALIAQDCSNASYITIADVVIGSFTGAGAFGLELGGVTAQSADINRTSLLGGGLGTGSLGDTLGSLPSTPGSPSVFTPGRPATPGTPSSTRTVGGPASSPATRPVSSERSGPFDLTGERGGPLVWIGLLTLGLLGGLIEGDRRKMRRAQREFVPEPN